MSEIESLGAIGRFIRGTEGATTLAEAASLRGMSLDQAAEAIKADVAQMKHCPDCGELMAMNYHDADGNCVHQPL